MPHTPTTLAMLVLLWIWRNLLMPELPLIPHELLDAARHVAATSQKWGVVADTLVSWSLPVTLIIGAVFGFTVANWFRKENR